MYWSCWASAGDRDEKARRAPRNNMRSGPGMVTDDGNTDIEAEVDDVDSDDECAMGVLIGEGAVVDDDEDVVVDVVRNFFPVPAGGPARAVGLRLRFRVESIIFTTDIRVINIST